MHDSAFVHQEASELAAGITVLAGIVDLRFLLNPQLQGSWSGQQCSAAVPSKAAGFWASYAQSN